MAHHDSDRILGRYRERFRRGPVGYWYTRLGGGFEITHGSNFRFNADGGGTFWYWGGPPEDPQGEVPIEWSSSGDLEIKARKAGQGDWELIAYDFLFRCNEYDISEVCIFQPNQERASDHEAGFWWSVYPLVHQNDYKSGVWKHWRERLTRVLHSKP